MEEVRMTLRLPADAAAYLDEKAREKSLPAPAPTRALRVLAQTGLAA